MTRSVPSTPDAIPLRDWLANQIAIRPAVPAAAMLMIGIGVHPSLPILRWFWLIVIAVCLFGAIRWRERSVLASAFLGLAIFLIGVCVAQLERNAFPANHIAQFARDEPRLAEVELFLDHEPRILADSFSLGRPLPPKQVCVARVTKVKTWSGWADSAGDILVQIDEPHPRLAIGQTVRALGLLQRPSPGMNPGQFNWADYYREQRVLASIGVNHVENIMIESVAPPSWADGLRHEARQLLSAGFSQESSLDRALLCALLLGDHDPELRDVQEQFRRTGTSHHLAISGMHVAVLGGVVLGLCRLLRLRPRGSAWIAMSAVILYGIVALPSPPVIRSVLLCVVFSLGLINRRSVDAIQLLAVSVLAMLLYHPLDLFNAGFQLSFGTVLGLILFTRRVSRWLLRDDPDMEVLHSFNKLSPRQRMLRTLRRWTITTLAASLVAWVISAPLIAFHFEQVNPLAVFGSVVLSPFVFAALIGGFLKIVLTLMFPFAAPAWATLSALPMEATRDIVALLSKIPGADLPIPSPPAWGLSGFYLALVLPLLPFSRAVFRRSAGVIGSAVAAIFLISPLLGFRAEDPSLPKSDELSITLLAVGAGQCAVIAPPRGPLVLIDCGSSTLRDPLRKCIAPFMRHLGRNAVGRLLLSHGDYDHISAAAEIVEAYGVHEVMTGPHFIRHAAGNAAAESLLKFLDASDRSILELVPGNRINLGGGATLDVLWPGRDVDLSSNDCGLVLKLTYAGRNVLFPADIQVDAERALLANGRQNLHADVLIAPHHGSNEQTTADFVAAVAPTFVLCSNDRTLSMKQRDFDRTAKNYETFRTNEAGAVTVRINRDGEIAVFPFRRSPVAKEKEDPQINAD